MSKLFGGVAIAAVIGLTGCNKPETKAAEVGALTLINAGDAKACAHPEVLRVLQELIGTPKGDESDLVLPINATELAKLQLPAFTVDRITLTSVDPSVKRLTCSGFTNITADIGGPSQHFESEVSYSISPSAANPDEFILLTNSSIAAERVNIAMVQEMARSMKKDAQDQANEAKLHAALAEAASSTPSPLPSPAGPPVTDDMEAQYSADYHRCMEGEEAASGVTAALLECTGNEFEKQDGRLNRAYGSAMAVRQAADKDALRNAQRAWIKKRDSQCADDPDGGTLAIVLASDCRLSMTTARAIELEGMAR